MSTTVVDIYNQALSNLGSSTTISQTTDPTVSARVLNRFYEASRDFVLSNFPWPFSLRVKALAILTGESFVGWNYVYEYPSDCLRMRQIVDEGGARVLSRSLFNMLSEQQFILPKFPYLIAVMDDETKKLILTDVDAAYGLYTKRVTNPAIFDEGFKDIVAWHLAAKAGPALQVEKDYIGNAWQQFNAWSQSAHAAALNETQQDPEADSSSITCR